MGMSLGILPIYISHDLKLNNIFVGVIIGLQPLATLLTRAYSGRLTDTNGAKKSTLLGIGLLAVAGIMYLLSSVFSFNIWITIVLLILSRLVHGVSESMLLTGATTLGIGLLGTEKSGKIMTWNGIAMYAGITIGAPLGIALKNVLTIDCVYITFIMLSFISWIGTINLSSLPVNSSYVRIPFYKVIGKIAKQGLGLAFSSIGFACISSFITLLFADKNWGDASLAFLIFGTCFIFTRILFFSYPDRFGGIKVALVSLVIEIIGQVVIGYSTSRQMAIIGCGLTGIGFSLIYPALGILVIKKIPSQMRGTALGAYAAFFDFSLCIAGPTIGLIAGRYNYQTVYLFGGLSGLIAMLLLIINY